MCSLNLDELKLECNSNASNYPKTLLYSPEYPHRLENSSVLLRNRRDDLFSPTDDLRIWERESCYQNQGSRTWLKNKEDIRTHFGINPGVTKEDPSIRFIFVAADDSRSPLNVTQETLFLVLTYLQVMSRFGDLLLSFGQQHWAQDFHFSGFFAHGSILGDQASPAVPEIARSSNTFQLCYILKAPEKHDIHPNSPWSVRPAAVFHSLDLETFRATWITVKGNDLLKDRIASLLDSMQKTSHVHRVAPAGLALASSLAPHSLICDWAVEQWRWYINFLETKFQTVSRRVVSVNADKSPFPVPMPEKTTTFADDPKGLTKRDTNFSRRARVVSWSLASTMSPSRETTFHQPHIPQDKSDIRFPFEVLQQLQEIGDKANEALLILKANSEIFVCLENHYKVLAEDDPGSFPGAECSEQIFRFVIQIQGMEKTLKMEQTRVETLLKLIEDRKSLLYGFLNHQNMKESKISTQKMEHITEQMHQIAHETQQETVSMRIITLVTLFFLPGTFISTLMSTDIVKYDVDDSGSSHKVVHVGALKLFFELTLPLMVFTFAAWGSVYGWRLRKESIRKSLKMVLA